MSAPESSVELRGASLREAASWWYTEMNGGKVSGDVQSNFQRWLAESRGHREAYDSVARTQGSVQQAASHPHILALRHQVAIELTQRNGRWSRASFRVAVAAVVMAGAVGLAMVMDMPGWMAGKGRYSTEIGERIQVVLPDQSQMTLNTQTRIKTAFSADERRVVLKEGQALFEVSKDPRRPFIVEAAGRQFIAVGTAFDVRVNGERVQVTMVEGSVKVPAGTAGAEAVLIKAGDQLSVGHSSPDPAPRAIGSAGVERAISWREGRVIFEETALSEAIAEMNRYSEQRISLDSPELEKLKVSGAFATGKTQAFVEAVMVYFPVEVARLDRRGITLRARQ